MDLMRELLRRLPPLRAGARILDVGSLDVNGTYRELFDGDVDYTGVDLKMGANVDCVGNLVALVTAAPDRWIEGFDLVVSGQALEHDPEPWATVSSMVQVCADHGHIAIIAPFVSPVHHPPDYFRFTGQGMAALLRRGLELDFCDPHTVFSGLETPDAWAFAKKVRAIE